MVFVVEQVAKGSTRVRRLYYNILFIKELQEYNRNYTHLCGTGMTVLYRYPGRDPPWARIRSLSADREGPTKPGQGFAPSSTL